MKSVFFILATLGVQVVLASPMHLDLEMSSSEYQALLKHKSSHYKFQKPDEPAIKEALLLGGRLSKWLAKINSERTPDMAIRLTSATTRRGIPIDKPNIYSPSTIKTETESILKSLPLSMKKILNSSDALPSSLPLNDETFILHARKIDRNYQSAARYKAVDEDRDYYIDVASKDVRGLHYLQKENIGEFELQDTQKIPEDKVKPIKEALTLVCLNATKNFKRCKKVVESSYAKNKLHIYYRTYIEASRRVWNSFFLIPPGANRIDLEWTDNKATVPFNTPEISKFIPYLQDNIEDEFRFKNWSLKINFGFFPDGPYLKFIPGVVPHVNALGGNEIVMDSNQPIEEYESQWTIRHEFGHIIGLPDCYHEFYDVTAKAYVNYQLDTTDLMCSRAGNMNERIYLELKKVYGK